MFTELARRRLILLSGFVYALTRCLAFSVFRPPDNITQKAVLDAAGSPGGVLLYALLWGVAAIYCLAALPSGNLGKPLAAVIGLMTLWGVAYALAWASEFFQDHHDNIYWQTCFTYLAPAFWTIWLIQAFPDRGGRKCR